MDYAQTEGGGNKRRGKREGEGKKRINLKKKDEWKKIPSLSCAYVVADMTSYTRNSK